jgi:hypothetical protein
MIKIIGPVDATWEKCNVMQQQFPQVVLEDCFKKGEMLWYGRARDKEVW